MVDIKKFWIEGIILEKYPRFPADRGADIDGNGNIEGSESFGDLNGDGILDGREDYRIYLQNNRALLGANIPFFKWGEGLSVENRIHRRIYLELDIYPDLIQSAYLFLTGVVRETDRIIGDRSLSPQDESIAYYDAMRSAGISFKAQGNSSFVKNIAARQLDCDTSAFTAMAVGDERGNTLQPVLLPKHVFLRGKNKDQTEFNIDIGEITTDEDYRVNELYGLNTALLDQGFYLQTLNDEQMEGLLLDYRGLALVKLGRHPEAIEAYDRAIKINSNDASCHYNRGIALAWLGRHPEAIEAYDRAIKISPNDADFHYGRGIALYKLGRHPEAIEAHDRAIKINPHDAMFHYDRGNALNRLGRYSEAAEAYDRAIKINPNDARFHYNRGVALAGLGRYPEAIEAYDRAIKINPNDAGLHYNRGNALAKLGRYPETIEAYDRAIKINPNYADCHYNRGTAFAELGWHSEAIKAFEKACQLNPDLLDLRLKIKLNLLRIKLGAQRFISRHF